MLISSASHRKFSYFLLLIALSFFSFLPWVLVVRFLLTKVFEFHCEKDRWRITEISCKVSMFIIVDVLVVEWLATVLFACGLSLGQSDFYKSRCNGNQVCLAQ